MTDGPSPPSFPPPTPEQKAAFEKLLRTLFSDRQELIGFLDKLPSDGGEPLKEHLPGGEATHAQTMAKAAELLQSRGWPRTKKFWYLLLKERPLYGDDIIQRAADYLAAKEIRLLKAKLRPRHTRSQPPPLDRGWPARPVRAIHDAFGSSDRLGKRCVVVLHFVVGAGQGCIVIEYEKLYGHLYQEVLKPEGSVETVLTFIRLRVAETRARQDPLAKRILFIVQRVNSLQTLLGGLPEGWFDVIVVSPDRIHEEKSVVADSLQLDEAKAFACACQRFSEEECRALENVFRIMGRSFGAVSLVREAQRLRTPSQLLEPPSVQEVDLGALEKLRTPECGQHPANCLTLVKLLRPQEGSLTGGWTDLVEAYRRALQAETPSALRHVVRALVHVAPGFIVPTALLVSLTQAVASRDMAGEHPWTRDDVLNACASLRTLGLIEWRQDHVVMLHAIQQAAIAEANGLERHVGDFEAISEVMRGFCPGGPALRTPLSVVGEVAPQSYEPHVRHWVWSSAHPNWCRKPS